MATVTSTRPDRPKANQPTANQPKAKRSLIGRHPVGLAFTTPYVIFLVAVFAYPLGFAVYMSLFDYFFAAPGAIVDRPFVGLQNFTSVLTDREVLQSFRNVLIFLVINVPLTVILSLVLATALNAAIPFRTFFRVSYYVPYVTASVAVVGVWLYLFNSNGLINKVLGPLAPDPAWLINERWAMPAIALYVTWKQLGFYILLYLAALQNVPKELYEAASVDGASRLRAFRSVTIPGVRPASTLVVLLATITGANLFTEPYLLTGEGGPNGASASPVLLMYKRGIEQGKPGVAAAIGLLLVVGVLIISLVNRWLLERD